MQRTTTIITGVSLLVLLACIAGLTLHSSDSSADDKNDNQERARSDRLSGSIRALRQRKDELTSAEAVGRIRRLLLQKPSSAHKFETVEKWVGQINEADLQELIEAIAMDSDKGLTGWVRCALYAEWARRDPAAALAAAEALPDSVDNRNFSLQQVLFSVLRGWAETDPMAALDTLARLNERLGYGSSQCANAIYRELARRDPEAAWQYCKSHPVEGFFQGLDGRDSVIHYLNRWSDEFWNTDEARKGFEDYRRSRESSPSPTGRIQIPIEEATVAKAALALANHDLDAALDWLRQHGTGNEQDHSRRVFDLTQAWATAHPEQALKLINDERFRDNFFPLTYGAIRGDPALAPRIMQEIKGHSERAGVLLPAISSMGSNRVDDFFPAPGQRNRLPNFQERYDALLEGIEVGNFSDNQKASVLKDLNQEFAQVLHDEEASQSAPRK